MPEAPSSPETDRVAHALRERIFAGAFAPGERLVQDALADELGVSRLPVRTALSVLAQEGLVVQRPRRGTFVRPVSLRDLADVLEVQTELDALAARLAAERGTPEQIAALDDDVAQLRAAVAASDAATLRRVSAEARGRIAAAADNAVLAQLSELITPRMRLLFANIDDPTVLVDVLESLHRAIAARDGDAAEAVLRDRLAAVREAHADLMLAALTGPGDGAALEIGEDDDHVPGTAEPSDVERIAEAVRGEILRGERAPGSRLSERAIAEQLGVSRIPVRPAIDLLVAQGLVVAGGARSAARVSDQSASDVVDLLIVCERLSRLTVRIASQRIGAAGLAELRAGIARVDEAVAAADATVARAAMEAVRRRILELCDNEVLVAVDEIVRWRLQRFYSAVTELERGARFCRAQYHAVAFRDAAFGERAIAAVMGGAIRAYQQRLSRRAGGPLPKPGGAEN